MDTKMGERSAAASHFSVAELLRMRVCEDCHELLTEATRCKREGWANALSWYCNKCADAQTALARRELWKAIGLLVWGVFSIAAVVLFLTTDMAWAPVTVCDVVLGLVLLMIPLPWERDEKADKIAALESRVAEMERRQ
jgi:hypothetical protein